MDIAGKAHRLMTIPKTVFGLSAGVVLLALTGCDSKPDAWCTVMDDLRAIAEAREMADRVQDREIATLLAHLAAMGFTERLEPGARMSIMWRANGWNAVSAMDQVVGAGLLDESAYRKALKDLEVEAKDDRNGDASLLGVLWEADVFLAFDAETGMLPCRHDQLLSSPRRRRYRSWPANSICLSTKT